MPNYIITDAENKYIIATATTPFGIYPKTAVKVEQMLCHQPQAEEGFIYRLRVDTFEWELCELPSIPEDEPLAAEEALNIITGGVSE